MEFLCLFKAQTNATLPNRQTATAPDTLPDSLITMATFMSGQDPWCTDDNAMTASMYFCGGWTHLWDTIEMVLKNKLRPLFTKQRNPNITNEGRKDFHPVPLPRFDGSALDDSAKPWKNTDIYATSVLSWVVSRYKVCVVASSRKLRYYNIDTSSSLPTRSIWKRTSHFWSLLS